jgi:hypothetical protein
MSTSTSECANMACGAKGIVGPPPSILHAFYTMTLQHVQVVSILKHTIVIVKGSSRLGILSKGPPLSSFARKGSRT